MKFNLLDLFRRSNNRSVEFSLATTLNEIPDYLQGFDQAIKFTKSLGYDTTLLSLGNTSTDLLDAQGAFTDPPLLAAGIHDLSQSAIQCLKWSHYLQPFFEQHLQRKVILTTGQLWQGQACAYGPTFDDVRRWNKQGLQLTDFREGGGFKLHAWLTYETGEIIDVTLLSTLALVNPDAYRKHAGGVIWGRHPNLLNCKYVPITVGNQIIEHIAKNSSIPLLANSVEELKPSMVFVKR